MATTAKGSFPNAGYVDGTLQTVGEQDFYTVTLAAGFNYEFDLSALSDASVSRSLVETLIGPDGAAVTRNTGVSAFD